MTTYILCKRTIENKTHDSKEKMMTKLDVFLLNSRISEDEYNELVEMLDGQ